MTNADLKKALNKKRQVHITIKDQEVCQKWRTLTATLKEKSKIKLNSVQVLTLIIDNYNATKLNNK